MITRNFLAVVVMLTAINLFAQDDADADRKLAEEKCKKENYEEALTAYLDLLEDDNRNVEYNYRIGICYLNTNINKAKAIPYLELVTRQPKYEPDAMFLLGRAYHFAYRFDDALRCYNDFKRIGKGTSENLADVDREIQNCYNAKELMKYPLNVTFENLGSSVNTQFPEYYPFITADESFMVYNTKRSDGGNLRRDDGSYYSAVYISRVMDGGFTKSRNIGNPISSASGNVEVVGMSANGNYMVLYYDNETGINDIYVAEYDKQKNIYKKPIKLDENINSSKGFEIAACITNDGNTVYFASNRPGGLGGMDLYVSKRLPNGKFGPAVNLGPQVNTPFDEDFPSLSPDEKTLYFSSKGHSSMGGYDIFKSEWEEASNSFKGARNLGFPINTPEDNSNFRISENGRYGYLAAKRDDSMGDLDIYRVTFNDIEPRYTVITGEIKFEGSSKPAFNSVFLTAYDKKTNELVGNYVPNGNTGRFVVILPPGNYDLVIEAEGYAPVTKQIGILDKASYVPELQMDVPLKN